MRFRASLGWATTATATGKDARPHPLRVAGSDEHGEQAAQVSPSDDPRHVGNHTRGCLANRLQEGLGLFWGTGVVEPHAELGHLSRGKADALPELPAPTARCPSSAAIEPFTPDLSIGEQNHGGVINGSGKA
ncbi:MAG: hypothetical protein R2722_16695 [Tessaracoccus sp.]